MKAITPPRRRSLLVRGYDRLPFTGRIVTKSRSSSRRRVAIVIAVVVLVALSALFMAGRESGRMSNINAIPQQEEEPQQLRHSEEQAARSPIVDTIKPLKIAVAVTVTKDGPYLDGAAVLQHSIRMTKSKHDIDMVAIVHSDVQTTRPALKALGFRVIEFPPPILSKDIQGEHLRDTIDKSGCCGALELLKLCVWKLEEYDWVVSMDMDAIWLQNLDHLFEREDIPKGGFLFTYDFAMDNPGSKAPPVQGGFIAVRPSTEVYEQLVDIVRVGDFRPGTGWAGMRIGWCWGGQTVQGLLAYFSYAVEPKLAFPLDPCEYNSMATTKTCQAVDFNIVKSIHYTACQKPWECYQGGNEICARFLHAWWMVRNDLERVSNISETGRCCSSKRSQYCLTRKYQSIRIDELKALPMTDHIGSSHVVGHIVAVPDDIPVQK